MSIMLTKQGFEKINNELKKLIEVDRPIASQMLADTRPVGVVEDNPEYLQAIDNQDRIEKKIMDLRNIINDCVIFTKEMCKPNVVSFGATVKFVNCDTNEIKQYTIVSMYESDINNGLISVQSPFIRSMFGARIGEYFEFNDAEYLIIDINYSLLKD